MHFQLYQLPPKKGVMHLLKKQKQKKHYPYLFTREKEKSVGEGSGKKHLVGTLNNQMAHILRTLTFKYEDLGFF